MVWGSFGGIHWITLFLAGSMLIGLYYLLKNKSVKVKRTVLGVLSLSGIAAIIYNLLMWGSPLEYLPLHLCSITAILLPIGVFTQSRRICNLLLLWCLGALFALVVNTAQANYEVFSWTFAFYYFPHVLEFGIPILLFKLGLVKKDYRCIGSTFLITLVIYSVVHIINVWLNGYCESHQILDYSGRVIRVNYMFSMVPENPLLGLFYQVIPLPYWYLYLAVPIIAIYLMVVYIPEFFGERVSANRKKIVLW